MTQKSYVYTFLFVFLSLLGCTSYKPMWSYLVPERISKGPQPRQNGTPLQLSPSDQQNVKVVYNDGSTSTEVSIPILSSGQRIYIKHTEKSAGSALPLLVEPPTEADKSLEQNYVEEGLTLNSKSPALSLSKTLYKIRTLADEGQFEMALQFAEKLLERYPQHVQTLRAKGSLLLKMGEKSAALKAYEKAQEIEPSTSVAQQIDNLRQRQP